LNRQWGNALHLTAPGPDHDLFTWKKTNFSSATSPGLVQNAIEDVIEKRMGTTYGVVARH